LAVILVRGALKPIDLQIELLPNGSKFVGNNVDEFARRLALCTRGAFYFGAVFIGARRQYDLITLQALHARDCFRRDGRIGMPNVWRSVDVIDRCREVVFAHRDCLLKASLASLMTTRSGTPFSAASRRQSSYSGAKPPRSLYF